MGTPEFAVPSLEALVKHSGIEVVAVYTQPDRQVGRGLELRASHVKQVACKYSIPVYQPEKLSQPGEFEKLQALKPDLMVVVAFGQILRQNVLDLAPLGCINIHSSLLPRWRGAAPIQWAILAGESESGVTTQKMALKLDAGDILMQSVTSISATETAGSLHDRLSQMGAELIVKTIDGLAAKTLQARPQDESLMTYASKLSKEMENLEPRLKTAVEIDRQIRALNPWPGTSIWVKFTGDFERVKIKQARLISGLSGISASEGQLFEKAGMLLLGCHEGALEIQRLQLEGKKETDAAGFLNGLKGRGISLPLSIR